MKQKPTILAYAAGLMDGEGCIQIALPYSKKNNRRYHRLDVSIGQKDPRPIVWMVQYFGGRIQDRTNSKGSVNFWIIHDKAAGEFLKAIRPYLVLKGEQADVALAYRATVKKKIGNMRIYGTRGKESFQHPDPITPELDAYRDELRQRLSDLKEIKTLQ